MGKIEGREIEKLLEDIFFIPLVILTVLISVYSATHGSAYYICSDNFHRSGAPLQFFRQYDRDSPMAHIRLLVSGVRDFVPGVSNAHTHCRFCVTGLRLAALFSTQLFFKNKTHGGVAHAPH